MIVKILTKTLLVIYGLSIVGYGMLEVSHGLMHTVKNKFHRHVHTDHHQLEDHSTILHANAAGPSNDNDSISSFNSYFLFFEHSTLILRNVVAEASFFSETFERLIPFCSIPLVPPPLS